MTKDGSSLHSYGSAKEKANAIAARASHLPAEGRESCAAWFRGLLGMFAPVVTKFANANSLISGISKPRKQRNQIQSSWAKREFPRPWLGRQQPARRQAQPFGRHCWR